MIGSLIRTGRASLQSIGQGMDLEIDLESRVKKAKRWLKSKWTDSESHFIPYLIPIIRSLGKSERIVVAIDGSSIGECMTLMISIIWKNRAIPVYDIGQNVVPEKTDKSCSHSRATLYKNEVL